MCLCFLLEIKGLPWFQTLGGGMSEWLKETGCKPVGYAYVGSNPTPSTIQAVVWVAKKLRDDPFGRLKAGVAQW